MSKQSEAVKLWRKRTKERMIAAFGGACCVCSYDKCAASLDFHHLDPSQKDSGFVRLRSNPQSWTSIVIELRKCVMVCSNCHGEIHHGATVVPDDAPRFNEEFAEYKIHYPLTEPCPVCKGPKPLHQRTCSRICAAKMKGRVNWEKIDLVGLFKTGMTQRAIAESLGVSDSAVLKQARKLGLK
jgi:hypothetical protein